MELVGEEKKIQALFSDLRLEEARVMPTFATVLGRAQALNVRPLRAFNLSFALATALLICALVSLAVWSRHWQQSRQPSVAVVSVPVTPAPTNVTSEPNHVPSVESSYRSSERARALRLAARRRAEWLEARRAEIRDATAISSWQSPTATLVNSQNDALLNSLPQLNESVKELKSFLPNK